jgi:hypothetical protein
MGSLARLYRFVETEVEVEVEVKVGREERFIRSAESFMCESFAVCENKGDHIRDLRERTCLHRIAAWPRPSCPVPSCPGTPFQLPLAFRSIRSSLNPPQTGYNIIGVVDLLVDILLSIP